jgi:hypothetical protein
MAGYLLDNVAPQAGGRFAGANTTTYPRTLSLRMRRAGLSQTGAEGRLVFASGASPGAAVQRANLLQTGDQAVNAGLVTADELRTFMHLLDDPTFTFTMPLLISAWRRRPTSSLTLPSAASTPAADWNAAQSDHC